MTPQERIEKYGNKFLNERAKEFSIMFSDNISYQRHLAVGYLNGATEQRMIDIEKACREFMRFLNIRVDNPNYQLRKEDFSFWVEDFRKAMGEEK